MSSSESKSGDLVAKELDELRMQVQELEKAVQTLSQYVLDQPAMDDELLQEILDDICVHCHKDRTSRCKCVKCDDCGEWNDRSKSTTCSECGAVSL